MAFSSSNGKDVQKAKKSPCDILEHQAGVVRAMAKSTISRYIFNVFLLLRIGAAVNTRGDSYPRKLKQLESPSSQNFWLGFDVSPVQNGVAAQNNAANLPTPQVNSKDG